MINVKYIWIVSPNKTFKVRNHVHNCYELIFYHSAKGYISYFPNKKRSAKQNSEIDYLDIVDDDTNKEFLYFNDNYLALVPPKVIHDEVQEKFPKIIDIGFEFVGEDMNLPMTLLKDDQLEFSTIFTKIEKELENKNNYYQEYIKSLVDEIIILISRHLNQETQKADPILLAKNYIDEYFTTSINITDLAKQTGYGPEHFRFLFKKQIGMSPKEYIVKKRIDYSITLLADTNYPISKVAELSGYDDVSQFSVIFKKKMSITPFEYRKSPN